MRSALRTVVAIPVEVVWDDRGAVAIRWLRSPAVEDIRDLLRSGPFRFAVADVGKGFRWIAGVDRFSFWETEGQPHLAPPDASIDRVASPGGLAYLASEWAPRSGSPIVLLESHH